ncbi:EpsG family protein [Psychroflexus tropicus]|uniref:EpsG family protein n=1 Tax=Psychroflexus tropicus TaxID=197345 RepID=UPI00037AFE4E|nr:EpsG family protein [Psychroflexus tropicus]
MIPVEYYTTAYYVTLSLVLLVFFLPRLIFKPIDFKSDTSLKIFTFIILAISILFIGLRDPVGNWRYLGDTSTYTRMFEQIKNGNRTEFAKDIGFYLYMKLIASFANIKVFYLITGFIYVYLPYLTFKKWFKDKAIYVLIAFVVSMSFWAFGINGVRNGLATSIFLFSLKYYDKKWLMFALMILSVFFHKAMLLSFFAYLVSVFIIKIEKKALVFWIISIPLSLLFRNQLENLTEFVFSTDSIIQDERASTFFSDEGQNQLVSGQFRIDFIIYSAIAIFIGYWAIVKKEFSNTLYRLLFRTYVIANGIWILLIYAPYTNRIAYLSWFLMPIILTVPFISDLSIDILRNKEKLIYVIYGSLAFTIFMQFVI